MSRRLLSLFLILGVIATGLPACVKQPRPVTPEPLPQSQVAPPKPAVAPPPPPPPTVEPLVIVLSGDTDIYRTVAKQIRSQCSTLPSREIVVGQEDLSQILTLPENGKASIVALGMEASQAVLPLGGKRLMVFSLVYNYRPLRLLEEGMTGVGMLPPPEQVIKLFREINPKATKLALPVGPGMSDYTTLAKSAAAKANLELVSAEIGSDKELLHFTSRLSRDVVGYWLLPDNRILSRETIQQILSNNLKEGRQTIVFSPDLFKWGGLISARYSADTLAARIVKIIKAPPKEQGRLRGTIVQPESGILNIHESLTKTLGLQIPPNRRSLIWNGQ